MGAAKALGASIVVSGASKVQLITGMSRGPVRTPAIRSGRIAHTNPRRGQAKLVTLANDKGLACPIGDVLDGNLAISEKNPVIVTTRLVRRPNTAGVRSVAKGIDDSLRTDVIGRGWLEVYWRGDVI